MFRIPHDAGVVGWGAVCSAMNGTGLVCTREKRVISLSARDVRNTNSSAYYTILYYTILYYTILYYTILYYTLLCFIALHCTSLHYTTLHSIV